MDTNDKQKEKDNKRKDNSPSPRKTKKSKNNVEVHVCRFIDYEPSAICAAHLHRDNKHCAIGRQNGNIEIWDLSGSFIQRVIPGKGANTAQCLLWVHSPPTTAEDDNKALRLISCGLDGWITEWNLETLSAHSKISCHGHAIWNLAQCAVKQENGTYEIFVSAACDDGKVRIYRLSKDEFIFQCEFTTSARCLSTAWSQPVYAHHKDRMLVYGGTSNGYIVGFDFKSRQQSVNILVAPPAVGHVRRKAAVKPLIWSLCSLYGSVALSGGSGGDASANRKPPQIACSTSRGNIDVYDAEFGTLIQSYNAAKNEIFSLQYTCVTGDGPQQQQQVVEVLVAGCVDGRVFQLTRKNYQYEQLGHDARDMLVESVSKQTEFVQTGYHRYHTHDVNVVSITHDKVVSGGVDCQLIACSTTDFWTHYICSPLANSSSASKLVQIANEVQWIKDVLPVSSSLATIAASQQQQEQETDHEEEEEGTAKLSRKLFLYQKTRSLELWYLHRAHPIKVMTIKVGFDTCNILCSAISNDGQWIAVANNQCIKLWRVCVAANAIQLEKIFECHQRGCSTLAFSNDSKHLFVTPTTFSQPTNRRKYHKKNTDGDDDDGDDDDDEKKTTTIANVLDANKDANAAIVRIDLSTRAIDQMMQIDGVKQCLISALKLNNDASLCAIIVPSLAYAAVIHVDSGRIFYEVPRGSQQSNVCCIEFQKNINEKTQKEEELLYVIYANNMIKIFFYEYHADTTALYRAKHNLRVHLWCASNHKIWNSVYNRNNPFAFTNIAFNPHALNKALLLRPEYMFSLVINRKLPDPSFCGVGSKRSLTMMEGTRSRIDQLIPSPFGKPKKSTDKLALRVIREYDPIIFAEFIDDSTLLIVHAPWHRVSAKFKSPLYRKKYAI